MARKFRKRTPFHAPAPEDALYKGLSARVVAALEHYRELCAAQAVRLVALQANPLDTAQQTVIAHASYLLCEARGRALAFADAFTLAFPEHADNAAITTAIQLAGLDEPLPAVDEMAGIVNTFLTAPPAPAQPQQTTQTAQPRRAVKIHG